MRVLVVNAGSSSLKYQLIEMDNESVLAKGVCERIGQEGARLVHHGSESVTLDLFFHIRLLPKPYDRQRQYPTYL